MHILLGKSDVRVHASSLFDIKIWTTDYTNFTKICIFIDLFIYASTQPPTQKTESCDYNPWFIQFISIKLGKINKWKKKRTGMGKKETRK